MNGLTELNIFYDLLSMLGFGVIFGIFLGFILRLFKRFTP